MQNSICLLDSQTVDRIAAGEVLERPANLVKELVENSLDAHATEIEVDISDGGRTLKIRDNGDGIAAEDLPLAFARHATSKITQAEDLWKLDSFGFRGEALASVAAVAKATLISRPRDAKEASRIVARFGKLDEVESAGGQPGTLIVIEDLFENIPARKKFLKSDGAEIAQAKRVLKAIALSHPSVTFRILENGKLTQHWPARRGSNVTAADRDRLSVADPDRLGLNDPDRISVNDPDRISVNDENQKERAQTVLDHKPLFQTRAQHTDIHVEITFSSPQHTVGTSQNIWLFAQGRWIQDRSLQAAVTEAYRTLLMHGEFPLCVVSIQLPPHEIDVNIHPAKSQVKFRDPQALFRAVHHTLRAALEMAPWLPTAKARVQEAESPQSDKSSFAIPNFAERLSSQAPTQGPAPHSSAFFPKEAGLPPPQAAQSSLELADRTFFKKKDLTLETQPTNAQFRLQRTQFWCGLDVLGQSNQTYILAQSSSALFLIDQHAAHERVMFEELQSQMKNNKIQTQNFLVPITLQLEPELIEAALETLPEFETMGVGIEQLGPETLVIHSAPAMIKESSLVRIVERVAREKVDLAGSFAFRRLVNDLLATMACHSAIRAGQALSTQEMLALLAQMDAFPLSSFCPHGRPVYVEWPFLKLDKEFGRIV